MGRKPIVGEVWTLDDDPWECLKDLGDGKYIWSWTNSAGRAVASVDDEDGLTPPIDPRLRGISQRLREYANDGQITYDRELLDQDLRLAADALEHLG